MLRAASPDPQGLVLSSHVGQVTDMLRVTLPFLVSLAGGVCASGQTLQQAGVLGCWPVLGRLCLRGEKGALLPFLCFPRAFQMGPCSPPRTAPPARPEVWDWWGDPRHSGALGLLPGCGLLPVDQWSESSGLGTRGSGHLVKGVLLTSSAIAAALGASFLAGSMRMPVRTTGASGPAQGQGGLQMDLKL